MTELPVGAALLQAVLEIVDARSSTREELASSLELRRIGLMRRGRDRELVVAELRVPETV